MPSLDSPSPHIDPREEGGLIPKAHDGEASRLRGPFRHLPRHVHQHQRNRNPHGVCGGAMFAAVGRQMGVWRRAGGKACGRLCDLRGDSFLFLVKSFGGDARLCDGIALTPCQVSKHLLPLRKTHSWATSELTVGCSTSHPHLFPLPVLA